MIENDIGVRAAHETGVGAELTPECQVCGAESLAEDVPHEFAAGLGRLVCENCGAHQVSG